MSNDTKSTILKSGRDVAGWLILSIDNMRLAIPHRDAISIELTNSMESVIEGELETGWIEKAGSVWPAYTIDEQLHIVSEQQNKRRFCVLLGQANRLVGLVCDQVKILSSNDELALKIIPMCLQENNSPIRWLCWHEEQLTLVAKSGGLATYLTLRENEYESIY